MTVKDSFGGIVGESHCDSIENALDISFLSKKSKKSEKKSQIVGLGTACLDYLVTLNAFPKPDEKVCVMSAEQHGGGNIANTLSCISRLNLCDSILVTKLGKDSMGDFLVKELLSENVNVDHVVLSEHIKTPFTYVIVNRHDHTRTCIHTPMEQELTGKEISLININEILSDKTHLHLDSRQTEMAYQFAIVANEKGIPVSMDCEKDRPGMRDVLPYCNILFTNEHYPALYFRMFSGNREGGFYRHKVHRSHQEIERQFDETLENIAFMVEDLQEGRKEDSKLQFVVTSLGSYGSMLFLCSSFDADESVTKTQTSGKGQGTLPLNKLVSSITENPLPIRRFIFHSQKTRKQYQCVFCPAISLSGKEIVDTTGAGDSFIGAFLSAYYDNSGQIDSFEQCMQIATHVAARKIGYPGARSGLPNLQQLTSFISKD